MDGTLIELGVFLVGAGSGAALTYLKDRQLLHLYGDLVRQLSAALRHQWEHAPASEAEVLTRWLSGQAEQDREKNAS